MPSFKRNENVAWQSCETHTSKFYFRHHKKRPSLRLQHCIKSPNFSTISQIESHSLLHSSSFTVSLWFSGFLWQQPGTIGWVTLFKRWSLFSASENPFVFLKYFWFFQKLNFPFVSEICYFDQQERKALCLKLGGACLLFLLKVVRFDRWTALAEWLSSIYSKHFSEFRDFVRLKEIVSGSYFSPEP